MKKEKISIKVDAQPQRRQWEFNPVTRVVRDKTKYSRKEKHKTKFDY